MARRVLVVDDEAEVVDTLGEILSVLGYEVSSATTGEAAIASMGTARPHVVLLDLMMPGSPASRPWLTSAGTTAPCP
jgi:CheY-like chemotaxis protein